MVCFVKGGGGAGGRCELALLLGPEELLPPEPASSSGSHGYRQCTRLCPVRESKGLRMLIQGCRPIEVYDIFLSINELIFHSEAASGNKNINRSGRQ